VLDWITAGIGVSENRKTGERSPTVRIVDFTPNSTKNDWLAVSQFRIRIPGREQHILPDVVLFLNGLPVVVIECKSPKVEEPTAEAIDQLLPAGRGSSLFALTRRAWNCCFIFCASLLTDESAIAFMLAASSIGAYAGESQQRSERHRS
jgi:Type I restriction enzyme R protein N terminus (HSDR_N)